MEEGVRRQAPGGRSQEASARRQEQDLDYDKDAPLTDVGTSNIAAGVKVDPDELAES